MFYRLNDNVLQNQFNLAQPGHSKIILSSVYYAYSLRVPKSVVWYRSIIQINKN